MCSAVYVVVGCFALLVVWFFMKIIVVCTPTRDVKLYLIVDSDVRCSKVKAPIKFAVDKSICLDFFDLMQWAGLVNNRRFIEQAICGCIQLVGNN